MKSRRFSINDMYYFALCLLIMRFTLMSYRQYIEIPVFIISIPLLLIKVLKTRYTRKELLGIALVVLICASATIISHKKLAMWSGLLLIASKNIEYKKMFAYCFYTQIIMLAAIVILPFFTGEDIYMMIYRVGIQRDVKRYHFGIGHPNGLQFLALQISLTYMGMKGHLLKKQQLLFLIVMNTFIMMLSKSRTSYVVFWLVVVLSILFKLRKGIQISRLLIWMPVICTAFCLICTKMIIFGNSIIQKLDRLFEHRITFASRYIAKYPFNLVGHYIYELTIEGAVGNTALDCGYINLSLNNGLILLVVFIALYTVTLNRLYRKQQYHLFVIGVVYSVYFIMEGALLGFYKNLFIILFGMVLFRDREQVVAPEKGILLDDLYTNNRRLRKSIL